MCGMCRAVERFQTKCQQNKPCIKGRILLSEGIIACRPILGLYIYLRGSEINFDGTRDQRDFLSTLIGDLMHYS